MSATLIQALYTSSVRTVVSLSTHLHGLLKVLGASRQQHELLEREGVAGVRATVDDVKGGAGEDEVTGGAGKVGKVLVQGDTLRAERQPMSVSPFADCARSCPPFGRRQPWRQP